MAKQHPLTTHVHRPTAANVLYLHLAGLPGALGDTASQVQALAMVVCLGLASKGLGGHERQSRHKSQFHRPGRGSLLDHGLRTTFPQPGQGWAGATTGLPRFNKRLADQVPIYQASVQVSLRPSVLDPAGEATKAAAVRLGVEGITSLRIGKAIQVELEAPDLATAQSQLELLSDRLLANPVIEDWTLDLAEVASAAAGGADA